MDKVDREATVPPRESRVKLTPKPQIGKLLLQAGLVTQEQLNAGKARGGDVVDALIALGFLDSRAFVDFLVNYPGIAPTDLIHFEIRSDLVDLVDRDLANTHEVIPIDRKNNELILGCTHPLDRETLAKISARVGLSIHTVLCTPEDVQAAVLRYYPVGETARSREQHIRGLHEPLRLGQVADFIRRIETLPALPETVAQVRDAMNDPMVSVPAVVDIITLDPPIAAKVLSVANSAAYGFSHRIHELNLAVSLLGLRETYSIVLSAAIVDLLNKFRHFDYRTFFLEAISCATASRIVGRAAGRRNLPGIFSAGLLHDIGRAALWEVVPDLAARVQPGLRGAELCRAEEAVMGISHAEAGYLLATHWNLPEDIATAIRFHHAPQLASDFRELVSMVALADKMVSVSGTRFEDNPNVFEELEPALRTLGIDAETAEAMLDEFLTRYESALNDAFG